MSEDKKGWCNWSFEECLIPSNKWLVSRDCGGEIELRRGSSRNWRAYTASLTPTQQFTEPLDSSKCPSCGKYVHGVNPYDDGETWRQPNE